MIARPDPKSPYFDFGVASSHHAYLGRNGPIAVDATLVLEQLSNRPAEAVRTYRRFIADGQKLGHDETYYQRVDQRFLGDEKFIEKVPERAPQAEIRPGGRTRRFEKLLQAIAEVYGRSHCATATRAQLSYLARTWCGRKAFKVARRLKRDASMVSRLCASYEADRDLVTEKKIAEVMGK